MGRRLWLSLEVAQLVSSGGLGRILQDVDNGVSGELGPTVRLSFVRTVAQAVHDVVRAVQVIESLTRCMFNSVGCPFGVRWTSGQESSGELATTEIQIVMCMFLYSSC